MLVDNNDGLRKELAHWLGEGALALVLGAGISYNQNLPLWPELVRRCCKTAKVPVRLTNGAPTDKILDKLELVHNRADTEMQYQDWIREALYREVAKYDMRIVNDQWLLALGALLMTSARGSVSQVLTYNFDDLLEAYLEMHGFCIQTVTDLPALLGTSDVTIYHPHGFLPLLSTHHASRHIVFDRASYELRLAESSDPWNERVRDMLVSKVTIFLGLSGNDPCLRTALAWVNAQLPDSRLLGVWLIGDREKDDEEVELLTSRGIAPLYFAEHELIPEFLLQICQEAVRLV